MNWKEMSVEQHNLEMASRLRGLAAMVESCDKKVKIRMSARLEWTETKDKFETGILSFQEFTERFMTFTTTRLLEILKAAPEDDPTVKPLREHLEKTLEAYK